MIHFFDRFRKKSGEPTTTEEPYSPDIKPISSDDRIKCDPQIRELVTEWAKSIGHIFDDVAGFLEEIGIQTPVKLTRVEESSRTVKCSNKAGCVCYLTFYPSDPEYSAVIKKVDNQTIFYSFTYRGFPEVYVYCCEKEEDNNGNILITYCSNERYSFELTLANKQIIKIEIEEPFPDQFKSRFIAFRDTSCVEKYLLGMPDFSNLMDMVNQIFEKLGFTSKGFSRTITISKYEKIGKKKLYSDKLVLNNNKVIEFMITVGNRVIHIEGKRWSFEDGDYYVAYDPRAGKYDVRVRVTSGEAKNTSVEALIFCANNGVNEVKKQIKKI